MTLWGPQDDDSAGQDAGPKIGLFSEPPVNVPVLEGSKNGSGFASQTSISRKKSTRDERLQSVACHVFSPIWPPNMSFDGQCKLSFRIQKQFLCSCCCWRLHVRAAGSPASTMNPQALQPEPDIPPSCWPSLSPKRRPSA